MNANSSETRVETENNAVIPTTARGALELAWDLAHKVKKGQVIPAGTEFISAMSEIETVYGMAPRDQVADDFDELLTRTLDPLPDTEPNPDWLDAPAVAAPHWCPDRQEVWLPTAVHGYWKCPCCGGVRHWSDLHGVTPLYPKEGAGGVISVHTSCGSQVSTDEKDITPLDGDGESSGYSAACLKCDEDLFPFEIEQVPASEVPLKGQE